MLYAQNRHICRSNDGIGYPLWFKEKVLTKYHDLVVLQNNTIGQEVANTFKISQRSVKRYRRQEKKVKVHFF